MHSQQQAILSMRTIFTLHVILAMAAFSALLRLKRKLGGSDSTFLHWLASGDLGNLLEHTRTEYEEKSFFVTDNKILVDIISILCELVEILTENTAILQVELKQKIAELRQLIAKLKHTLRLMEAKAIIGKIAYDVDSAVLHYVLDAVVGPYHHIYTIKEMELAIKGKEPCADVLKTKEARAAAEERWETLQEEFQWTPRLYLFVKRLKRFFSPLCTVNVNAEAVANLDEHVVQTYVNRKEFEQLWKMHCRLCSAGACSIIV